MTVINQKVFLKTINNICSILFNNKKLLENKKKLNFNYFSSHIFLKITYSSNFMPLETKLIIFDVGGVVVPECGDVIRRQIAKLIGISTQNLCELSQQSSEETISGKKLYCNFIQNF